MSQPIHFHGIDYANVEAMPPEIRAAYEERQQAAAQRFSQAAEHFRAAEQHFAKADRQMAEANQQLGETDPQSGPAWGGPRAAGAVPVPLEFDPVTSLGPAAAVYEHDGISLLPTFGPPHPHALVVYRDGFAFRTGKDLHTWLWDEVAVIQSNLWYASKTAHSEHEYTLTKSSGEKVILDNGLKKVEDALDLIKKQVIDRLLPPLAQSYGAGQALTFGPVTIHKQTGLQLDGRPYAWAAIRDIKVERGRFTITLRDNKKHEARASAIPNIELLGRLIGLQFSQAGLWYY